MPATILDGKATAAAIRAELTERVAALAAAGHRPGLGTLLVGDDPGSRWYVNGKHRDCAEVGIASIQRELPATATQADVAGRRRRSSTPTRPAPATSSSCRCRAGSTSSAVLEAMDPAKDADGLHPVNLGRLVLERARRRCRAPRVGIVELLRRYDVPIAGAEVVVVGRGITVGRPLGLLLTRRIGERDRDPVPHRHPRPGRAHAHAPTSWSPRPACPG